MNVHDVRRGRRLGRVLPVAMLLLGLTACSVTLDAGQVGVPVSMAAPSGSATPGEPFRVTSRAVFGFWGLVSLKSPSLEKALATQLMDGKAIADVRIKVRSRWSDVLISSLTLGLIVPRAVTYEGVVVPR